MNNPAIDIVIPCYRVSRQIAAVIGECLALPFIRRIIVIDDACPERSGQIVKQGFPDNERIRIIEHPINMGVGGAVISGYKYAFSDGADIVVKVDGDGQMPPNLVAPLIRPILQKVADYTKGNRFYSPTNLSAMPKARLFGNAMLSLVNKFSSGYWSIIDPTNGFTAICRTAYLQLDADNLDHRYFFESDMLFQLGIANAVVHDVPMRAVYGDETSSLNISRVVLEFPPKYMKRFLQRIGFRYFLREFNIASLEIVFGLPSLLGGVGFGIYQWVVHMQRDELTPSGTTMIVGLLILMGFQMILSAINYDVIHEPQNPLIRQDDAGLWIDRRHR